MESLCILTSFRTNQIIALQFHYTSGLDTLLHHVLSVSVFLSTLKLNALLGFSSLYFPVEAFLKCLLSLGCWYLLKRDAWKALCMWAGLAINELPYSSKIKHLWPHTFQCLQVFTLRSLSCPKTNKQNYNW